MQDELAQVLERLKAERPSPSDLQLLQRALRDGRLTLATGAGAVALGGDANDAIIVTGNGSKVRLTARASTVRRALREDRAEADAAVRARALQDYLSAMRAYADELPYASLPVRRGRHLPVLSTVYVSQRAKPGERQSQADTPPETIEQALERYPHLLVEGGPGLGKSTLLRHLATSLAVDPIARLVPLLVSARSLATRAASLSESLLAEITGELGQRLPRSLPADFCASAPATGRTWLVLVDGLDEIVSEPQRQGLINTLIEHANRPELEYRFVASTRPLRLSDHFEKTVFARYTLQPFDARQAELLVRNWFSDAADADAFLTQAQQSRIADVTSIPLLLTMALVVYAGPGTDTPPLPTRRAGLYQRFVQVILEDEEAERATAESFRAEWRRRLGEAGDQAATELFGRRLELLKQLALWQQEARARAQRLLAPVQTESLVELAARWIGQQQLAPAALDPAWLARQIDVILERSGLLTQQGQEPTFIHDTFREYLAAARLADTSTGPRGRAGWAPISRWTWPSRRESVLLLLGIWSERGENVTQVLRRIWPGGREWPRVLRRLLRRDTSSVYRREEDRLLFAGEALVEGARVDSAWDAAVVAALFERARARFGFGRDDAAHILARLSHRAPIRNELVGLMRDDHAERSVRRAVADSLARLGVSDEGIPILVELAHRRESNIGHSVDRASIDALAALGRASELRVMLQDAKLDLEIRIEVARALVSAAGDRDALGLLIEQAHATQAVGELRIAKRAAIRAVGALAALDRADDLFPLLFDEAIGEVVLAELARIAPDRTAAVLVRRAHDASLDLATRRQAITLLTPRTRSSLAEDALELSRFLGGSLFARTAELTGLARSRDLDPALRLEVVAMLALGKAYTALEELADADGLDEAVRAAAQSAVFTHRIDLLTRPYDRFTPARRSKLWGLIG